MCIAKSLARGMAAALLALTVSAGHAAGGIETRTATVNGFKLSYLQAGQGVADAGRPAARVCRNEPHVAAADSEAG